MLRAAWLGRYVVDTAVVVVVTRNGGSILILAKCHQIHELAAVFELVRECILVVVLASLVLAETVFEMAACGRCSRPCTPVGIGLSKTVVSKSASVIIVVASVTVTFSSCRSGSCSMRGRRLFASEADCGTNDLVPTSPSWSILGR